jgi:hypothetical protein
VRLVVGHNVDAIPSAWEVSTLKKSKGSRIAVWRTPPPTACAILNPVLSDSLIDSAQCALPIAVLLGRINFG